jgi:UDP-N-acetylglucosamine transferase subunit ALG13
MTASLATSPGESTGRRIVVTVGTDHHPFNRLIGWTNEWLRGHHEMSDRCFVQYGTASVRPTCSGSQFLEVSPLSALLDTAEVIICHGGPGSISEAWARGRRPIVVPRLARLGEHVDDHQADFCQQVAGLGKIALAQTLPEFAMLVDEAVSDPSRLRVDRTGSDSPEAVARLGKLVEELVSRPRRRPWIGRGRRVSRDSLAAADSLARPASPSPELVPSARTNWQADREPLRTGLAATVNEEQE